MDLNEQEKLVEKARRDPDAFGELYDQFYSQIYGYALRRTASVTNAQDIVSEVFFKALKNLEQYHSRNNVPFSSWLYRIANNQINDYFRKNKHRILSVEEISDTTNTSIFSVDIEVIQAEDELKRQENFIALHENISKLPFKFQEVITLRYFENKQDKEIAQILDKKEATVRVLRHRGLQKLRDMMA